MRRLHVALAAGAACACVLATGCNGPLPPHARELLQLGYAAAHRGDYPAAIRHTSQFLQQYERSARADEAYYLRGFARYRSDAPDAAKQDLAAALSRTQKPDVRAKALLTLGDIAYDTDDMARAGEMFHEALAYIERGRQPGDHAHYRLGCVLQRQGRWREADVQFNRLIELFRGTELAKLAARRVHCNAWTVQAGVFSRKRQADKAAASLKAQGLPASVDTVTRESQLRFVVQVGRFATYEQAVRALEKVTPHVRDAFVFPAR